MNAKVSVMLLSILIVVATAFPQNENWLEKKTEDHLVETPVDHGSEDALTSSLIAWSSFAEGRFTFSTFGYATRECTSFSTGCSSV